MELNLDLIKTLMVQKELKQKDLSQKLECSPGYVCDILKGRKKTPSFKMATKLADALGVTVATILLQDNNKRMPSLGFKWDNEELLESEIEQIKDIKLEIGLLDFTPSELQQIKHHMRIIKNSRLV